MDDLRDAFLKQFVWEPAVAGSVPQAPRTVVGGMGGSHLAADLLAAAAPGLGLSVHHDYGAPADAAGALAVAVSHSGNTEETLSFINEAQARGLPCAAVSTGGKLAEFAAAHSVAHVALPPSALPPRACVGYHAVALLALMGRTQELAALRAAAQAPAALPAQAPAGDAVVLVYASQKNLPLAQYIKVQYNETAHAPAFINSFPELNHNEMLATLKGGGRFRVLLLRDPSDDPRVIKRMDVFAALAQEHGTAAEALAVPADPLVALVSVALWAQERAAALAQARGVNPNDTAVIEDFKKRIA
jgi:glucose/mannose-6-phosphate isomerase